MRNVFIFISIIFLFFLVIGLTFPFEPTWEQSVFLGEENAKIPALDRRSFNMGVFYAIAAFEQMYRVKQTFAPRVSDATFTTGIVETVNGLAHENKLQFTPVDTAKIK